MDRIWKIAVAMAMAMAVAMLVVVVEAQLQRGFYDSTCKEVESIVKAAMETKFQAAPTSAAGTLRLFFHDCFVNGCDGSVLLASTDGNKAERDADVNLSLAGDAFDAVVKAKEAVEAKCPGGRVSCADLLAIATRDLVGLVGGPFYEVLQGRRDSRVSRATDAAKQLPSATESVERLTDRFTAKGLSQADMVTLSGGHTIGFVHCDQFLHRLYPLPALSLDPTLAASLRDSCPNSHLDPTVVVSFDDQSPRNFDNGYFQSLLRGRGVIASDQELVGHANTSALVETYARDNSLFAREFAAAMTKLAALGVLTGSDGEIRKDCAFVNPESSSRD